MVNVMSTPVYGQVCGPAMSGGEAPAPAQPPAETPAAPAEPVLPEMPPPVKVPPPGTPARRGPIVPGAA